MDGSVLRYVVVGLLILLVLLTFPQRVDARTRCWVKDPNGVYSECSFPFTLDNTTYNACVNQSGVPLCPYRYAGDGTALMATCLCGSEYVGNCEGMEKGPHSGKLVVGWPGGYKPNMNCTWFVDYTGPTPLRNPSLIYFFTEFDVETGDGLKVYAEENDTRTLIYSSKKEVANPSSKHMGLWSPVNTVEFNFESDSGGEGAGLVGYYYIGFCSDFDGHMTLPPFQVKFTPLPISLLSDNFDPVKGASTPYRPNSKCSWVVPLAVGSHAHTLYFYRFDLKSGDMVSIKTGHEHHIFANGFPYPITSNQSFEIVFQSDDTEEGMGFEADVTNDGCSIRTVPVKGLMGTITDGSLPSLPYKPEMICNWLIAPDVPLEADSYIEFTFHYLTIGTLDILTIYEGDKASDPTLGRWQAVHFNESFTVTSNKSVFLVTFITDDEQTGLPPAASGLSYGFSFTYKVCTGKCLQCKAGTYYNITKNECKNCPPPTITDKNAQLTCRNCPPGSKWKSSQECSVCPSGTYSVDGRECLACSAGRIATHEGSAGCVACEADLFAVNSTDCIPCQKGYRPTALGDACEPLPVPQQPKNNETVLIYFFVGVGCLIIGIGIFIYLKNKKEQETDYMAVAT